MSAGGWHCADATNKRNGWSCISKSNLVAGGSKGHDQTPRRCATVTDKPELRYSDTPRTLCGGKGNVLSGGFSFQRFCGGFRFVQSVRGCVFAACAGPVGGVSG